MPALKAKTTGDEAWPHRWRGRWIWWTVNAKTVGLFNNGPDRPADAIGFLRRTISLDPNRTKFTFALPAASIS